MTYNEWRDELKNNLLSVSESERRRVLDYYAEAYADRRDAGYSEREIIDYFGAPYDAAQRILYDTYDDAPLSEEPAKTIEREYAQEQRHERREERSRARVEKREERERARVERRERRDDERYYDYDRPQARVAPAYADGASGRTQTKKREDHTWVFVLLCIVFAIPLFALVMAMVGVSISLCVAPIGVLIGGIGSIISGVAELFTSVTAGLYMIGEGVVVLGVSIILIPLCTKLVKLMWKLFKKLFRWLKGLFSGKENA